MKRSIIDDSRDFWAEIVLPLLQAHFPDESKHMAAGFFGYGSEVLRLDDQYSTDHQFGLRVNILLPQALKHAGHQFRQVIGDQTRPKRQGRIPMHPYRGRCSLPGWHGLRQQPQHQSRQHIARPRRGQGR